MTQGTASTAKTTTAAQTPGSGASRGTGLVILLAGIIGWLASFQLTVDDWRLLKNPDYQPACNLSPIVNCGSVMSSPQGSLFGFPNMLLGLGAFAAVITLGAVLLTGSRLHRRVWLALEVGALGGIVFVHWLIIDSLYELNKICPYCAVVWVVTIALFWCVTMHCMNDRIIPVPEGVRRLVQDTHWLLLGTWYGVIALLVLTRFWSYWTSLV